MYEPGDIVYTLSASRDGVTVRRGTVRFVDHREGIDHNDNRYERVVYGVRFDGAAFDDEPYPLDESAVLDVSRYAVRPSNAIGGAVLDALDALGPSADVVPVDVAPRVGPDVPPPPPGFDAANDFADAPSTARAVCNSLGIPYVAIPQMDDTALAGAKS